MLLSQRAGGVRTAVKKRARIVGKTTKRSLIMTSHATIRAAATIRTRHEIAAALLSTGGTSPGGRSRLPGDERGASSFLATSFPLSGGEARLHRGRWLHAMFTTRGCRQADHRARQSARPSQTGVACLGQTSARPGQTKRGPDKAPARLGQTKRPPGSDRAVIAVAHGFHSHPPAGVRTHRKLSSSGGSTSCRRQPVAAKQRNV